MSKGSRPLHIDLCTGVGGWKRPFEDNGWTSVGLEIRQDLDADVIGDVQTLPFDCTPDVMTMSPPCTKFARWMMPWLDEPEPSLDLVQACLDAVDELSPRYWIMENSRGLHQFWEPARKHVGPFYLWGEFPPFDVGTVPGKMETSGENPEERAKIPYDLADALRRSVESWGTVHV